MNLASAYPSSDISAGTMTVVALVMVSVLIIWLVMVYAAASERSELRRKRASGVKAAKSQTVVPDSSGADSEYPSHTSGVHV